MMTTDEFIRYVDKSSEWLTKVGNAREQYANGIIDADAYVAILDECDAFMSNMKSNLEA